MEAGPTRTCVACRAVKPQAELICVVSAPEGPRVVSSSRGRHPGRGAYVCEAASCVEAALKSGALRRALRHEGALPERLRHELSKAVQEGSNG